jgi:hypothetical protein
MTRRSLVTAPGRNSISNTINLHEDIAISDMLAAPVVFAMLPRSSFIPKKTVNTKNCQVRLSARKHTKTENKYGGKEKLVGFT